MLYFSTQRPIAPGTFPKYGEMNRLIDIMNYDEKVFCPEIEREAWGYVEYERAIPSQDADAYELIKFDPVMDGMAAHAMYDDDRPQRPNPYEELQETVDSAWRTAKGGA